MEPQDSCIFFLSQEFKRSYVDHIIYFKRVQENSYVIIALYVDDLILAFNDLILLKETMDNFLKKFGMVNLGENRYCLGIQINCVQQNQMIYLN
jgi:ATP-binding cassette subfamily B (MDR/TAP) protein 1